MGKLTIKSLREAREIKGLTQSEVSKAVDITESYYCLIEKGNRVNITLPKAASIAAVLGITLDDFFMLINLTNCDSESVS